MRPRYLDASDHPWLFALLREYSRFTGRRRGDLDARMREPLPVPAPPDRLRRARHVLDRLCKPDGMPPREAARTREAAFLAAAERDSRSAVLKRVAEQHGCHPGELVEALFSDLPSERRMPALPPDLDATELSLRTNLALVQGLCARSTSLSIDVWGNARAIVRVAQLRGLLCTVRPGPGPGGALGARLQISGPLALFRRTRVYGRALASLVPHLCWCDQFQLGAKLVRDDREVVMRVESGAPIFPARRPEPFDSKLEARFARDFERLATDWDLHREPAPVQAGDRLIFPDFAIRHRRDPTRIMLLEIAGFWTADYLQDKLRHLREAGIPNLILCMDAARQCDAADLPSEARIIRFKRRIDPKAVLALLR